MTNDYSEFLALKPNSNKIYKYEIINDDEYEGRTYELYSKVKISKDEWDKLLLNLFHQGRSAYLAYKELLKTPNFFTLEEVICIEVVAQSTIGYELGEEDELEHSNADACFRRKTVYEDGAIEYAQDYLEL